MSPRDFMWFLSGVMITAVFSAFFIMNGAHTLAPESAQATEVVASSIDSTDLRTAALIAPDVDTPNDGSHGDTNGGPTNAINSAPRNAGSIDEVTRKLAARLASQGGSDADWRLLEQSYDFMGRKGQAAAARAHQAPGPAN